MLKVALTGASGLIGSLIVELLKNSFDFISLSQKQMDITNKSQVNEKINQLDFDIFIHLAAYTNVDAAETNKQIAYDVNVNGTKNLFQAVMDKKKNFIYVSTDFVFDGKKPPYFENSQPNPISYYGQTKFDGEKIVKDKAMIIRLSYPYRTYYQLKKDFVSGIKSLLERKQALKMITDSLMTPTLVDDIAYGLKHLLNHYSPDIFHLIGANSLSPYDAGQLIARAFKLDRSLIQKITYEEYFKNRAKRPQFAEIKSKKNNFWKMKTFEEGLKVLYDNGL